MLKIEIETDNAAFEDDAAAELARIIRKLAATIEDTDDHEGSLRDANGNTVGRWTLDL